MPKKASFFSKKLIAWYLENKRDLPWRHSKDPYTIWLSEIILQQTRVAQGLPYFEKFISTFPTVQSLATAPEDKVLKLWQGLGYYSRARNLHKAAKYVADELEGIFPTNYKDLLQLKGVGDYTASAIASFCYDEPTAVVDGNVYRVLSRVFGIETPINSTLGGKEFKTLAQLLLNTNQPATHNQAIMEFGAQYCVPKNPACMFCVFKDDCVAYQTGKVTSLPVKLKKTTVKKRFFHYAVLITEDKQTLIQQRTGKGIWQNLYEFPLIEEKIQPNISALKNTTSFKEITTSLAIKSIELYNDTPIIHKLSHQHLYTHFWIIKVKSITKNAIPLATVEDFAVPILIGNFIEEANLAHL